MSYIGTRPELAILERVGPFTGDGTTSSFTLSRPPGNAEALLVVEGGVVQQPNVSYEISGYNLNFIDGNGDPRAPSAGVEIFGLFRGLDVSRKALGTAASRQIGTNSNDVPSITLADSRYANTAGDTFTGNVSVSGTVTADDFNTVSDIALKENVETIGNALDTVTALRGVTFTFKESGKDSLGLIAQEVEKVVPSMVATHPETGNKTVSYSNLVGLLIEAIKEQQSQIDDLKSKVYK